MPGVWVVEYSLPGFSTVRREGVELTAGFTANIDTQMSVGGIEETITVTGATPTVDVQNVRTQQVLEQDVLNALPNAQNISAFAALTLGVSITSSSGIGGQDVGGTGGEMGIASIHNNRPTDMKVTQEGMNVNNAMGTNGGIFRAGQHFNMEAVEEVTIGHTGMNAETETAGMNINYIPKEGGNTYSASARATFTNEDFQSDNVGDLVNRGASSNPGIRKLYDYAGAFGGPITRDRLWFFTGHRWWGDQVFSPGSFFNAANGEFDPSGRPSYVPDQNRRGYIENFNQENSGRITWQATDANKITYFGNYGDQCICFRGVSAFRAPEAGFNNNLPENHLSQVTYTGAVSNAVLIEAGYSLLLNPFGFSRVEGVGVNQIPITEALTGFTYNSRPPSFLPHNTGPGEGGLSAAGQENARGSLSYVTGSHAFKFGGVWAHGRVVANGVGNVLPGFSRRAEGGPVAFILENGVPNSIFVVSTPFFNRSDFRNMGFYAQDQWTMDRLTLNLGVRFDTFDGWTPEQDALDSAYVDGFHVDRVDAPTYRDISPRIGFAYDVRGDGRTAFKASAGRYVAAKGTGNAQVFNPSRRISTSNTRSWDDLDGDFFPDGDPSNPAPNGELGQSTNPLFGSTIIVSGFNDDFATENRSYTWQYSASVDQELRDNVRVTVSYNRTQHYNQSVNDQLNQTPADHDPYCITPSLGPSSGQEICGFTDITLEALLRPDRFRETRLEDTFGDQTETYNGVDISTLARFDSGALVQGGLSIGRTVNDRCFVVDDPEELYNCEVISPWFDQGGQIKFSGLYPLPGGVDLSAVYQNLPGTEIRAQFRATNADIAPSLGRDLTAGTSSTKDTVPRNNDFEDRLQQLDFRVSKSFTGDFGRALITLDLYNAFNANTVRSIQNLLGPSYLNVRSFMGGRLVKIGAQFSWN